jgi:CRISPR-associated protein Csx3
MEGKMKINLFPAVLLAGPPHRGKSVLAYLLADRLKRLNIQHYLLRAVPDGEGNWFLESENSGLARILKNRLKTGYSPEFVEHMVNVIQGRSLPLVVDIGGRPSNEQFDILQSCTHSILLYGNQEEKANWLEYLGRMDVLPVAELYSTLEGDDQLWESKPILRGQISGLQRDFSLRRSGLMLDLLVERLQGIFAYPPEELRRIHLRQAPLPAVLENDLFKLAGHETGGPAPLWQSLDLETLHRVLPAGQPMALYGRGPVWLAAMLAAHALPGRFAIFDVRYGWLEVESMPGCGECTAMETSLEQSQSGCEWLNIRLPHGFIEPEEWRIPPVVGYKGLVLSGALPRWAFAAMARCFSHKRQWVGVFDPVKNRVVVVHSNVPSVGTGIELGMADLKDTG